MNNTASTSPSRRLRINTCCSILLLFLFVYTASAKLLALDKFKAQMQVQAVPDWSAAYLIWIIPVAELVVAFLLLTERWRYQGMWGAAILMTLFTGYVSLVLFGAFHQVPCSCGGVIQAMGWHAHLFFNIFFMLLSYIGIYTFNRERSKLGSK